jgi:hypothetical protein
MMDPDWLVAVDDAMCARLRCCTLCGRTEPSLWFDIWHEPGVVTVAVMLCARCRGEGGRGRERIQQLLERRYGGSR